MVVQAAQDVNMESRKLCVAEHGNTRKLWEEIFQEDTKAFLDYYYEEKTKDNKMFVMEEEKQIIGMLHLNPYEMCINKKQYHTNYIVAVATDAQYRKRGIMAELLKKSLGEMYERKEPITFLMPAAEAIYYPFDFRVFHKTEGKTFVGKEMEQGELTISYCEEIEAEEAADFANAFLQEYDMAVLRDAAYYTRLEKEQQSEDGHVVIVRKAGKIVCTFCYAMGEQVEIRETIYRKEAEFLHALYVLFGMQKVNCAGMTFMARVVHLEMFLKSLPVKQDVDMCLEIQDSILKENTGRYHIVAEPKRGMHTVERTQAQPDVVLKIGELLEKVFEGTLQKVFLNEVV